MNQKILEVVLDLKDRFTPKLRGTAQQSNRSLGALSNTVKKLVVALASLIIIRQVVRWLSEATKEAFRFERSLVALNEQVSQFGVSADSLIRKLQLATQGQVSLVDLVQATNKAVALIGPQVIPQLEELATVATKAAVVMGTTVAQAIDSLAIAIGRQSRLVLDNLGLIVSVEQANATYAASIGKTSDQLTAMEQKQAFLNATLEQAREKFANITAQVDLVQLLIATWENFRVKIGTVISTSDTLAIILEFLTKQIHQMTLQVDDATSANINLVDQGFTLVIKFGVIVARVALSIARAFVRMTIALIDANIAVGSLLVGLQASANIFGIFDSSIRSNVISISDSIKSNQILSGVLDDLFQATDNVIFQGAVLEEILAQDTRQALELTNVLIDRDGLTPAIDATGEAIESVNSLLSTMEKRLNRVRQAVEQFRAIRAGEGFGAFAGVEAEQRFLGRDRRTREELAKQERLGFLAIGPTRRRREKGESRFDIENILAAALGGAAGGGFGGALGAAFPAIGAAFGPIGTAVGGLIGSLFGRKRQRGDSPSNPVHTKLVNPQDISTAFLNVVKPLLGAGTAGALNELTAQIRLQGQRIGAS